MGRIGRRIANRYRLVEKLGTGGMSVVWRAHDEILGREVALKILSPQLADDPGLHERMRLEALAAARLCHPHITAIFDFGEQASIPYVVMELHDGESVSARLSRTGPLPWPEAVTATAEVASALAAAHARGIVHRDITPANVMLTGTGAKVVDFGISALVGQRDAAPDGSLLGTPAYLAPERLAGGQVVPAADVYALGLLLYRLLTARLPWPAGNTTEALRAHLYADPEPLPSHLPAEVTTLCMRCLAKNPADRPPASEVATRLGAVAGLPAFVTPAPPVPRVPSLRQRLARRLGVGRGSWGDPAPASGFGSARPGFVARQLARTGPVVPARRSARLRAALRVGRALRLGRAKPLGGGLFQGGQLAHELVSGRHRIQAAAATVMLLLAIAVTWTTTRQPEDTGPAQAAAVGEGPPAGERRTAECKVRYRVDQDTGNGFQARLTVVNTGEHAVGDGWRMEFAFPGTQRLTDTARAVEQNGRKIVLRGRKNLAPGGSVTVNLRGAYRDTNPLPLAFRLDGHICEAEVLGVAAPIVEPKPSTPKHRSTPPKRRPAATPPPTTRTRPRPTTEAPVTQKPKSPTPRPDPPTESRSRSGFSLDV